MTLLIVSLLVAQAPPYVSPAQTVADLKAAVAALSKLKQPDDKADRKFLSTYSWLSDRIESERAMVDAKAPDAVEVMAGYRELALAVKTGGAQRYFNPYEYEAMRGLKALFVSEKAFFAEFDEYSADYVKIGFMPEECTAGAKPEVPRDAVAGCHFGYRVTLKGKGGAEGKFEAEAFGATPATKGQKYKITDQQSVPAKG